jgi:hypothetical protein
MKREEWERKVGEVKSALYAKKSFLITKRKSDVYDRGRFAGLNDALIVIARIFGKEPAKGSGSAWTTSKSLGCVEYPQSEPAKGKGKPEKKGGGRG